MKRLLQFLLLLVAAGAPELAVAQLELLPNDQSKCIWADASSVVAVILRNPSDESVTADVRIRMLQTSSSTAATVSEAPWKTIHVQPGQSVLESAQLKFPAVRAKTKFLLQWFEGTNHVIGTTEVWVYPTNLLQELKPLCGAEEFLGVFDPQNELRPALHDAGVRFVDLGEEVLDAFRGRLAIVGPFASTRQMSNGLAIRIKALAGRGVPVVWLVPPPENRDTIVPSFYAVAEGASCVIVAQQQLVKDFSGRPQSQLNLIHFCKLALERRPLPLPYLALEAGTH